MPQTDNIIEIHGLTKVYGDGVEVKALDGLDLDVKKEKSFP
ncbi:hypothetical protein [Methanohalophilus sp. WG1-DM]|nr:lipoprotein-releasing system ATP-binding protein [Methanohalophilus sp. WG1-DM]